MVTKTLTYTDLNGKERTETQYFDISEAELLDMEANMPGGYGDYLTKIIESENKQELMKAFMNLVKKSYGVKSEDGRSFVKSEEQTAQFVQTVFYSKLLMELVTKTDSAVAFANEVIPNLKQYLNTESDSNSNN